MSMRFPKLVPQYPVVIALIALPLLSRPSASTQGATGEISGSVQLATSRERIGRAQVSLVGSTVQMLATTDIRGVFQFKGLPPGAYSIAASHPRYLSAAYGQSRPLQDGTSVVLVEGAQLDGLEVRLFPASVISGYVVDDSGQPAPAVEVRCARVTAEGRMAVSTSSLTDDRGRFRLFGLIPGTYLVAAAAGETLQSPATGIGVLIDSAIRPNAVQPGVPAQLTYFPSATDVAGAALIRVDLGQERNDVDITLADSVPVTLSGQLTVPADVSPEEIGRLQVEAITDGERTLTPSIAGTVSADGRFSVRNVPPGTYTLVGQIEYRRANSSGTAATKRAVGRTRVNVSHEPVSNLVIGLSNGATVSGIITFQGDGPRLPLSARVLVQPVRVRPQDYNGPGFSSHIEPDGRFRVADVPEGRYSIRLLGAPNSVVTSAVVDGQDSLDFPFVVAGSDVNSVDVRVDGAKSPTEVSGVVRNEQGKTESQVTVLIFPVDQRFWTLRSRRVLAVRPNSLGQYQVRGLPPGRYYLVASGDVEPGSHLDPNFLRSLSDRADTIVEVATGGRLLRDLNWKEN